MNNLTSIFNEARSFKVASCNLGEQNGNYVTTLVSKITKDVGLMKVASKLTLYVSLSEFIDLETEINIDPEQWSYIERPFTPEDSEEVFDLKWISYKG